MTGRQSNWSRRVASARPNHHSGPISRLQLALRRARAARLREKSRNVWPIYEPSGRAPEGWPGWPEGKRFAFALAHDVLGEDGLSRCRSIAEVEMDLGFRSCFYFAADANDKLTAEFHGWLRHNGFEVGVHAPLFAKARAPSPESCACPAKFINRLLESWNAVGFRSAEGSSKLDSLNALRIKYDASTFDTNPFALVPAGVQTVFPFWVNCPSPDEDALRPARTAARVVESLSNGTADGHGFIEIPTTLPSGHCLFVLLRERGADVWEQKLRWLADKGALALLNTRPDCMAPEGTSPRSNEYPTERYCEFLEHVRLAHAGSFWHALPKEVAAYCAHLKPRQSRPPRRVAVLSYSYYQFDNRVRRYAETLARRGDEVRVFCLGSESEVKERRWNTLRGVQYLCLQSRDTPEAGQWSHLWRQVQFLIRAYWAMGDTLLSSGCELLHVHNIPDFLVFAGARLKRRGAKVILDIHDIVPELYGSKFESQHGAFLVALRRLEAWSCRFADHVIIANHLWKRILTTRSAPAGKVTALLNNVDLELFAPNRRARSDDGPILIYPGTLNHHQGLDLAIRAVAEVVGEYPRLRLHIHGGGPALQMLKELVVQLDLSERVMFLPLVPLHEVAGLIANADIGIVPKRADGFGGQAYSTKIMEFMSQGLPVIVSRTPIDQLYFNDSVVAFFEPGNYLDLADKIRRVAGDREYCNRLSTNGYAYAQANSWDSMKHVYLNLVDRLTATSGNFPLPASRRTIQPLGRVPTELAGHAD